MNQVQKTNKLLKKNPGPELLFSKLSFSLVYLCQRKICERKPYMKEVHLCYVYFSGGKKKRPGFR